jgi:hypothetical protein
MSVRTIVNRMRPGTFPDIGRGTKGARSVSPFRLHGLLRCPCGGRMVGATDPRRREGFQITYRCHRSGTAAGHPWRTKVNEAHLMPWIEAEATRLRLPDEVEEEIIQSREDQARLEGERAGVGDAYIAGAFGKVGSPAAKAQMQTRLAKIDGRLAEVEAEIVAQQVPPTVDWDASPETINGLLRSIWSEIDLGDDLRPVRAEWKLPKAYIAEANAA